ncbi:hypothetical protein [Limosilactobacillus fermentum]|uniref:hypothetical protein n=1 Tax=Limosilactobacillus fermentum TaxID=1613 RepID=UPI0005FBF90E|nr:hypothetical protein [Limosilactobacillus fermentum]
MNRDKIKDFKAALKEGNIKNSTIKYYPPDDQEAIRQAQRELKSYTVDDLVKIVNRGFKNDRFPVTHNKLVPKKTISNTLRRIETRDPKTQRIIDRYVRPSDLEGISKQTWDISNGKGRPYKKYSYYYVLCLNAIFKENSTKTIDQQVQDRLDKALLTPKEIDDLFKEYLGESYSKINQFGLKGVTTAIYNRQRRLKSAIPRILDTYRENVSLKKYLSNLNNTDSYIEALRTLLKMADNDELYNSDVVRLADQLTHEDPASVISYAKHLAQNHQKLKNDN